MRSLCAAIVLAGVTLSLSAPAGAGQQPAPKDFTITVPVDVKGTAPSIRKIKIHCAVLPTETSSLQDEIGSGNADVSLYNHFSGNVVIAFNASPGKDRTLARFYTCTAKFGDSAPYYYDQYTAAMLGFPLVAGAPFYLGTKVPTRIPGL